MTSSMHVFCLFLMSRLATAQSAAPYAVPSAFTNPWQEDFGIFQLVTPTTHANQVAETALLAFGSDAGDFYASYILSDPFDFQSAIDLAAPPSSRSTHGTFAADADILDELYSAAVTSLFINPTSYLSRLHASASPFPSPFSSSLLSQATGILLGYESLVSKDVLSRDSSSGPITPGISIAVGAAVTSVSASSRTAATQASQGPSIAASTSSSKAAGVPVVTASPMLMFNAAAAAVGVLGMALM